MADFLAFGQNLISSLGGLGEDLITPFHVPILGDVSVAGLILGGSLFTLLTYRTIKFFTDIVL